MKRAFTFLPIAAALAGGLYGCGGSSSSAAATTPVPTTSGVVTGSYFRNAKVCIDLNNNGRCDTNEPSTTTDNNGAFTLSGTGAVVAEIGTDAKRYDPDSKIEADVTLPLVFRAPAEANGVVSAISTEVQAIMDESKVDMKTARAKLAAKLGVTEDQLLSDHNKLTDVNVKQILKAEIETGIARISEAVIAAGKDGDLINALQSSLSLTKRAGLENINTVVVIYAENRGFDNLYGLFPGADGIPGVNPTSKGNVEPQKDVDGSVLPSLPPVWNGVTAAGQSVTVPQAATTGWANKPFQIDDPKGINGTGFVIGQNVITRDLVHRFYNNQMQINAGKNDKFAAYADSGALTMGYYDGSKMTMWQIAQQYTLADNFFQAAFGGSFLNHQYLICACAPEYPNADTAPAKPSISVVDTDAKGNFLRLTAKASGASALNGAPAYVKDGAITAADSTGKFYAVNTMQPPFQPSGNTAAASGVASYADPLASTTLPAQSTTTIGDQLTAKGVKWAWYSGAWNSAIADAPNASNARKIIYGGTTQFQPHHQPFNYYKRFDPATASGVAERTEHLKDFDASFLADAATGKLPAVSFYKPQGNLNQHPGYASVTDGDQHIANVISQLQKSPQWKNMLVVVTYDENGGFYDHASVPKGDRWGPGTRIPAIVISPFAKKGFVDHTQYDTTSTLRFITRRFGLTALDGLVARDKALVTNGFKPMGDLTNTLDFANK